MMLADEQHLIVKIASRPSTEELILFIAEDDAMTKVCTDLRRKIARKNKQELRELDLFCRSHHLSVDLLSLELQQILSIFAPQKNVSKEYQILGLDADADRAQVKQAFRQLSIKYHPDTSGKENTAKFIEISRAYQSIMNRPATAGDKAARPTVWRHKKKRQPAKKEGKNRYIYLASLFAGAFLVLIIAVSLFYQKQAMLNNLSRLDSDSFSPPSSNSKDKETLPVLPAKPAGQQIQPPAAPTPQTVQHDTTAQPETISHSSQAHEKWEEDMLALTPQTKAAEPLPLFVAAAPPRQQPETPYKKIDQDSSSSSASTVSYDVLPQESPELPEPADVQEKAVQLPSAGPADDERQPAPVATDAASAEKQPRPEKETENIQSVPAQSDKEQERKSPFAGAKYRKAVILPTRKKIQKKKVIEDNEDKAVSRKTTVPSTPSLQDLQGFFSRYTTAYTSREIRKFAAFFTPDAQENGTRFSAMRKKYTRLFNSVQSIDYDITLVTTDLKGKDVAVTGRFKVLLTYSPSRRVASTGSITFLLTGEPPQYRVRELTYSLDAEK
ncbi:MAG: DnaJ domain-containing protein [Candidatus Electrothrix sp. YB6]